MPCTDTTYYKTCGNCRAPLILCVCGWHKQVPPNRNPPPPPPRRQDNAGRYDFSRDPFAKPRTYYNNAHICGQCNGVGCKQCRDDLRLRQWGCDTFPVSRTCNDATPPAIQNRFARKLFTNPWRVWQLTGALPAAHSKRNF